jgi:hypothetical protein
MRRQAREELLTSAYTKLEEVVQLLHEAGENVIAEQVREAANVVDVVATGHSLAD